MRKKELRPLKLTRPEQFAAFIQLVWDELYWANTYYDIFKEASRLSKRYKEGVKYSPFFSAYTLRAHCQTALVYLHRIYDQNKDSFGLHRFLLTVRSNRKIFDPEAVRKRREGDPSLERLIQAVGTLNDAQLDRDIEFCSSRNPKVLNLKMWRDRITFHKDEREIFRQKPFEEDHPLPFADIDELIDAGFEILNRYSAHFDTTLRTRCSQEWKDMEFVFEALTHHPDFSPRV